MSDGVYVASADVNGDRRADLVVGADAGGEPRVKVFDLAGLQLASFLAFDSGLTGGVRVAAGDLDGDGKAAIVVGSGPGQPASVRVFTATGTLLRTIIPFSPFFTGGVYPAVGDLNGDGRAEIAVGAGAGGDGVVRTFDANGNALATFQPYGSTNVDVRIAIGDVLGDGQTEIVTTAGRESAATVYIFRPDGTRVGWWTANNGFRGGEYVAVQEPLGPALQAVTTPVVRGVEGNRARLVVTLTDPARAEVATDYAATVSWGDHTSSTAQIADKPDGIVGIVAAHPYRRPGSYVVQVTVADRLHRSLVATGTATIVDAALRAEGRVLRLPASRVVRGTIATFVDGNPLAAASNFTASIDWGDGSHSTGRVAVTGAGRLRVVATHGYARRTAHVAVVRLSDSDGAAATARTSIRP